MQNVKRVGIFLLQIALVCIAYPCDCVARWCDRVIHHFNPESTTRIVTVGIGSVWEHGQHSAEIHVFGFRDDQNAVRDHLDTALIAAVQHAQSVDQGVQAVEDDRAAKFAVLTPATEPEVQLGEVKTVEPTAKTAPTTVENVVAQQPAAPVVPAGPQLAVTQPLAPAEAS